MQQPSIAHPPSTRRQVIVGASLLRLSIWQRLAIAAGLAAILWGAVAWALVATTS
jgi:hypothetical protein